MEILNFDLDAIENASRRLAKRVEESNFRPEYVLYVERGGLLIGYEVANYFGCQLGAVSARRSGGKLKSRLKVLLRLLPRPVLNLLRKIESYSKLHRAKGERNVVLTHLPAKSTQNILIVDDAVDSGATIQSVIHLLVVKGYNIDQIRTAVITVTEKKPLVSPDYKLYENTICVFPWSVDSSDYDRALARYAELKRRIDE